MERKQYFIGVNKRNEDLIIRLFDLGALLMFYYHPYTIKLNREFNYYDGEWMFNAFTEEEINEIRVFLRSKQKEYIELKFQIIPVSEWRV